MISLAKQRKALEAIQKALIDAGEDPQEVAHLIDTLQRRPLLRFFVLLKVEDEARAATGQGRIDWDAIGDFLVKIAPIIMEIIKLFL